MSPTREVKNKWIDVINTRLELDCRMTHPKYGRKAIPKQLVMQTWSVLLRNEESLPTDWVSKAGGLVGIDLTVWVWVPHSVHKRIPPRWLSNYIILLQRWYTLWNTLAGPERRHRRLPRATKRSTKKKKKKSFHNLCFIRQCLQSLYCPDSYYLAFLKDPPAGPERRHHEEDLSLTVYATNPSENCWYRIEKTWWRSIIFFLILNWMQFS